MLYVSARAISWNEAGPGRHVVLMEQIYRNARKTVVYLGDKSVDSDLAAEYLQNYMSWVRGAMADFINQKRLVKGPFSEDPGEMMRLCTKSLKTSQTKLFEGFDQNTVQEALINMLSRP
jgi:hypothetical protein